jgi:hypothetical protein
MVPISDQPERNTTVLIATHLKLMDGVDEATGASIPMWSGVHCAPTEWGQLLAPVEATGKTNCDACGHPRRSHSRNGCTETGCPCTVAYMDLRADVLAGQRS